MSPGSTTTSSAAMTSCERRRGRRRASRGRGGGRGRRARRGPARRGTPCARGRGGWAKDGGRCRRRGVVGADEVDAGAVAVVVDGLLDPVAVGVELGADVGERVPLRRVLQRERHDVVGPHVDVLGVAEVGHLAHVDVVEGRRVAVHVLGRGDDRRVAALVERGAAREVERQAEAEADAGLAPRGRPASTFSGVSRLMRPSSSSSPQSPHVEPSGPLLPALRHRCIVATRSLACNRRSRSTRTTFPPRGGSDAHDAEGLRRLG